jgi:type II secretory pathway pseudopilin PulG
MVSVYASSRRARCLGFSFIELIVIMGIVAVMAGLSVGWLQNAGRASGLVLARSQLLDAARRAQSRSMGGRLATLTFRTGQDANGREVQEAAVHVAETVLSHAFERLDGASGMLPMEAQGDVKVDPLGGRTGGCAVFGRGGVLSFQPQAAFAVTEGLDMEVWLVPTGTAPNMVVLEGQGSYEVALFRALSGGDYDVRLRVNLRPAEEQGEPVWTTFETEGAPVKATGRWVHLRVAFDGQAPLFEVDTLERPVRRAGAGAGASADVAPRARRIYVPPEGGVTLRVGSTAQPFQGRMDGLVFRGVFRLRDDVVTLPDRLAFEVLQPSRTRLPFHVRYANGRLDPVKHPQDVVVQVRDTVRVDDLPLVLELGRSGLVRADLGAPPSPASPSEGGAR